MKPIVSAVITAAVVCGIMYLFVPPKESRYSSQPKTSVYEEVRASKTLRAAYVVGAPLFLVDPNTKRKSGIFYEIVEETANKLDLKVEWVEEVGYGEMIQGLTERRYDIVGSGVWLNGARGAGADFTIPAYYDAVLAYVRQGDQRFNADLSVVNSPQFTISTMDGELGASIAADDFPNASIAALPQAADFTQLILNVVNKKADIVFLALAPARAYQAANPGQIQATSTGPLRVFPVAIPLRKGEYELKESLDYALTEMLTNGEIDKILRRYENASGSYLRVATPYSRSESPR